MQVLFVSVEMAPLVKIGGLADVAGSLPKALVAAGHDVRVIMPLHEAVDTARYGFSRVVENLSVETPRGPEPCSLWQGSIGGVTVYLVESGDMFARPNVYGEPDDTQRWLFFCDAVLAALARLDWRPDVLHLNDWHSAFVAARMQTGAARLPLLYTIHNLALKGDFDEQFAVANGLERAGGDDAAQAGHEQLEPWMWRSGMGQGILHADLINTVSETYAREILTPEFGAGLDPILRRRGQDVFGILNGIDDQQFDPATDPHLPAQFSAENLGARAEVRQELRRDAGLPESAAPVLSMVTRLFWQKGADILVDAAGRLLADGAALQLVVLGSGDQQYEQALQQLASAYPGAVKVYLGYDPVLAQLIYGGSDMFLMPLRYEPCGLGQMIAMRYGSVPVVRRTGGLADTVPDADAQPNSGRGFAFDNADGAALVEALRRALAAFGDAPRWQAIQQRGMRADFSWREAAGRYLHLYETAITRAARR